MNEEDKTQLEAIAKDYYAANLARIRIMKAIMREMAQVAPVTHNQLKEYNHMVRTLDEWELDTSIRLNPDAYIAYHYNEDGTYEKKDGFGKVLERGSTDDLLPLSKELFKRKGMPKR